MSVIAQIVGIPVMLCVYWSSLSGSGLEDLAFLLPLQDLLSVLDSPVLSQCLCTDPVI